MHFHRFLIEKKTYIKTANIAYVQSLVVIMLYNTLLPEYGILSEIPLVVYCYIYMEILKHTFVLISLKTLAPYTSQKEV